MTAGLLLSIIVFWLSAFTVFYIYFGYPLAVAGLALLAGRSVAKQPYTPKVSILIAAYNEQDDIARTIQNKLDLDYPAQKLEVIVVSDGSTDRTDELVGTFDSSNVALIRQSPRAGKTAALNLAVEKATGDILVFSDANSIYEPQALRKLVQNFSDPAVGYVTGKMVYTTSDGSLEGDGCTAYMKYENALRAVESRVNSVVGVDGGIDAVRAELYRPMQPDQLPDFVLPLTVVKNGYRVVYEPEAILREAALSDSGSEYRMRVRVALRALWAMYDVRAVLNPLKYPLFAWQLWSHKVLRYTAFVPMILLFAANIALLGRGWFYQLSFAAQVLFYLIAFAGYAASGRANMPGYLALPYYFVLLNWASAHAFLRFLRKHKMVIWNPRAG